MSAYLTTTEADALAATLPAASLAAYLAATTAAKAAALELATIDIDSAMRYQGRRYDGTGEQVLEFPRYNGSGDTDGVATVWDWDATEEEAVIPLQVKLAVLFQADGILSGAVATRTSAGDRMIASESVGGMSQSYHAPATIMTSGGILLVTRAAELMKRYRLRSGSLL